MKETNEPSVGKEAKTKCLDVDMIVEQGCQQRSVRKVPILRPLPLEGFEHWGALLAHVLATEREASLKHTFHPAERQRLDEMASGGRRPIESR